MSDMKGVVTEAAIYTGLALLGYAYGGIPGAGFALALSGFVVVIGTVTTNE